MTETNLAPHRIDAQTTVCISVFGPPHQHRHALPQLPLRRARAELRLQGVPHDRHRRHHRGVTGPRHPDALSSMPHKETVIPLVDTLEPSAAAIGSVNTIVNDDGVLTASNTDYLAIDELIADHNVDPRRPVILHGSGGMAKRIAAVLHARGADQVHGALAQPRHRGRSCQSVYGFAAGILTCRLLRRRRSSTHGPSACTDRTPMPSPSPSSTSG